ncbi:glycosyltransferase family 2 protein (plasmid) [Catenovulum sp. SX2]|uniref:glycosyltransferase family 2 protein n=1 Tax=Catenovulum sp. SX2 TaxID=3398614 RepID=UPI003F87DBD2
MNALVSVIIPNYNCAAYLPAAVKSVFAQDLRALDIIIIDDGSTDGSLAYLETLAAEHESVRLVRQGNQGVVAARNKAIQIARSDLIAFLDADDIWQKHKLVEQVGYMYSNPEVVMTFTNYQHVTECGKQIIDCFSYWDEFNPEEKHGEYQKLNNPLNSILATNVVGTSTVVARKQALIEAGLFDAELKSASDWDMWLKLANIGDVAFSTSCSTHYLMRSNSITSNRLNRLTAMQNILSLHSRNPNLSKKALAHAYAHIQEGYAEYYRELGDKLSPIWHDLVAIYKNPLIRNLKHLCHDLKRAVCF